MTNFQLFQLENNQFQLIPNLSLCVVRKLLEITNSVGSSASGQGFEAVGRSNRWKMTNFRLVSPRSPPAPPQRLVVTSLSKKWDCVLRRRTLKIQVKIASTTCMSNKPCKVTTVVTVDGGRDGDSGDSDDSGESGSWCQEAIGDS
jgi:hypothetical protein